MKNTTLILAIFTLISVSCQTQNHLHKVPGTDTNCMDSIAALNGKIANLRYSQNIPNPLPQPKEKYNAEVDKLLNRVGEVTDGDKIFTDFKNISELKQNEIHPRSKDLYGLIKTIYDFAALLNASNNLQMSQKTQFSQNIVKMGNLNDLIKSYAGGEKGNLYFLFSESQKEYYRNLVKQYQKLYE
jgi:hypothetical protein